MLKKVLLCVLALGLMDVSNAAELPSYMKSCSRSDPKLNECATASAKAAISIFTKGDPELGIPVLDPISIGEIRFGSVGGNGLNMIFRNSKLSGTTKLEVKKMTVDLKKRRISVKVFGDLVLTSDYEVSGRLLIIPLNGKGLAKIKIYATKINYIFTYNIVKGKDGKDYMMMDETEIRRDIGKAEIKLENLFNGDNILGETTNRILNDSWKEVIDELSPPIIESLKDAITISVTKLLSKVPFDEVLTP